MYPYQRTPMGNPYISPIHPYIVGVYGLLSPRIPKNSLEVWHQILRTKKKEIRQPFKINMEPKKSSHFFRKLIFHTIIFLAFQPFVLRGMLGIPSSAAKCPGVSEADDLGKRPPFLLGGVANVKLFFPPKKTSKNEKLRSFWHFDGCLNSWKFKSHETLLTDWWAFQCFFVEMFHAAKNIATCIDKNETWSIIHFYSGFPIRN